MHQKLSRTSLCNSRSRRRRRLCILALLPVVVSVSLTAAPGSSAKSRPKPKSRSKVIDLTPRSYKTYYLTVNGRYRVKKGDEVDEGSISAPNMRIQKITQGKYSFWNGSGDGRVTDHVSVGLNCELRGQVTFNIFAAAAGTLPEDELVEALVKVPDGFVGFAISGTASGLAAQISKGAQATQSELGGIQQKTCKIGDQDVKIALAGTGATESMGMANQEPLIFLVRGERLIRERESEDVTYWFEYILGTTKQLGRQ